MRIEWERQGDVVVAVLSGRIDGGNAGALHRRLEEAVSPRDHDLVLNFDRVSFISSAGLRVNLLMAKQFDGAGRKFAVCSLSGTVRAIFKSTGFDRVIAIHESQADAFEALGNG